MIVRSFYSMTLKRALGYYTFVQHKIKNNFPSKCREKNDKLDRLLQDNESVRTPAIWELDFTHNNPSDYYFLIKKRT